MALLRIDKILSSQEIASRKEIKMLIKQGRIKVDGKIVARSEDKFDPENCEITLDDEPILYKRYIYIMLNKPKGVVSASRDSREKTVLDLLPPELRRKDLFPAGRLDRNTEGLLIITDDGEFSHKLLAPKSHVNKLYEAVVDRKLAENDVEKFSRPSAGVPFLIFIILYSFSFVKRLSLQFIQRFHRVHPSPSACAKVMPSWSAMLRAHASRSPAWSISRSMSRGVTIMLGRSLGTLLP